MRRDVITVVCAVALVSAASASAQGEQQLRQAFEGQYAIVKMDLPATNQGLDLYPEREPAIDFRAYSQRIREFGTALREGQRVLVTTVRVKNKNIEFQLGGGGYGVFGDDSGSVYVPSVSKSNRERDLEKAVKNEPDPERRRRLQSELDDLRRDREREQRDRDMERRAMEERKKSEIADKRRDAGSRVNVWFQEGRLAYRVPTPAELAELLLQVIDFGPVDERRMKTAAPAPMAMPAPQTGPSPAPSGSSAVRASSAPGEVRRGMNIDEVHAAMGRPTRTKPGKQGDLDTLSEWYESADRVTEVTYVGGVVVKFTVSSK